MMWIAVIGASWTLIGLFVGVGMGRAIAQADRHALAERAADQQLWELTDDGRFVPSSTVRMPVAMR